MLLLFIGILVISSAFLNKCDAAGSEEIEKETNSMEKMMLKVCNVVFGITSKRGYFSNPAIKVALHAFMKLKNDDDLLNEAIKLHVLLKLVAGATEVHKDLDTFKGYLKICDNLVEKEENKKKTERKKEAGSSHHGKKGGMGEDKGKQEEKNVDRANLGIKISSILEEMELSEEDWKSLTEKIPEFKWKDGGISKCINIKSLNPKKWHFETPFEFGFTTQEDAESTMKAAFDLFIHNNPGKQQKIYQLCHQIEMFAYQIYEEEIKKKAIFANFCKNYKPNEHPEQIHQLKGQSSGKEIE